MAGWTIGGVIADDPRNREDFPLLVEAIMKARAALAAHTKQKDGEV